MNEIEQVNGGIYEGASPWIAVTGLYVAAVIVTGGGALAIGGALIAFGMAADSAME
ncbi:hypothetical protein [Shewanella chilikensis]|nr:hypothetical protein [Shewanella chilikensis]MCA0951958.1 hypothetical protein [Shewanella chilikensis]